MSQLKPKVLISKRGRKKIRMNILIPKYKFCVNGPDEIELSGLGFFIDFNVMINTINVIFSHHSHIFFSVRSVGGVVVNEVNN